MQNFSQVCGEPLITYVHTFISVHILNVIVGWNVKTINVDVFNIYWYMDEIESLKLSDEDEIN